MQPLLENWEEIEPLLKAYDILLFLDFDGTLTPIVEHPNLAHLNDETRGILRSLAAMTDSITLIIISGRLLEDIKQLVAIPGIYYVGNHGFELEGPSIQLTHPGALEARVLLEDICRQLNDGFRHFPGIFLENKIFTLSIHYREVPEEKIESAKKIFIEIVKPYAQSLQVILRDGKKVWEIRPGVAWNKGTTLLWLMNRVAAHAAHRVLPIYVGDDQTDEDAFKVVHNKGLSVKVLENENEPTEALYSLSSPAEVLSFLKRLHALKSVRPSVPPDALSGKVPKAKKVLP